MFIFGVLFVSALIDGADGIVPDLYNAHTKYIDLVLKMIKHWNDGGVHVSRCWESLRIRSCKS